MDLVVGGARAFAYTGGKPFDATLPAVVLVHGGEQDHSVWTLHARYLAHHGRGVLAVDLPGHGRSAGSPLASIEAMADWIVALLDAAGVKKAALVGHSMGSLVALDCAARFPDRVAAIALLGAAFPMRVAPELLDAAKRDEPAAQAMINVWSHAAHAHYPGNPGPGSWVVGANLRLMQRMKPGVLYADFAACDRYAAGAERAAQVHCPAILIVGRDDRMTPARSGKALAGFIPGAKLVEVRASGHALMAEQSDEVLDALVGFLQSASTSSTG